MFGGAGGVPASRTADHRATAGRLPVGCPGRRVAAHGLRVRACRACLACASTLRVMPVPAWICDLGRVPYDETADLQRRLRAAREAELLPDTLLVLEHDPVITAGPR